MKRNFNKNFKSGFTLLELLVVVAIIGILAAIVVIALSDARKKGADAGVKSNLAAARSQAEVFYNTNIDNPNTYINVCDTGTVGGVEAIGLMVETASKSAGLGGAYAIDDIGTLSTATCNVDVNGTTWAAEVPLSGAGGVWCVDSAGTSERKTTSIGAGTVCPAS